MLFHPVASNAIYVQRAEDVRVPFLDRHRHQQTSWRATALFLPREHRWRLYIFLE